MTSFADHDYALRDLPDAIRLGSIPVPLVVNLVDDADFTTSISADVAWAVGDVVTLVIGAGTWTATIDGTEATFNVDKAVTDLVAAGTAARLVVTNGTADAVWAVGRVVRRG